jgi:hypothetical protein
MRARSLFLGLALALLAGCAGFTSQRAAWVQDTLYFGLSKPGGSVSQQEWQDFVDAQVTPRFPDGLTQWEAKGQWREAGKPTAKEDSRVLQIVHAQSLESEQKIQAIRQAYREKFMQSSVLRVKSGVLVEF